MQWNIMASSKIENHFNIDRIPQGISLLLFLLYAPFGTLLLLIRILFCVQLTVLLSILPKGIFIRQWILRICGCILGIVVSTENQDESVSTKKILISNHISEIDSLVVEAVEPHMLASRSSLLPFMIYQLMGYEALGSTNDVAKSIDEYLSRTDIDFSALVFPEESTTNGNLSLLKFSAAYFQLSTIYQPIVLTAKRPSLPGVKLTVLDSNFWSDLLWTFFVPYTLYKIKYLPAMEKEDSASAEDFAKCVRKKMSESLGLEECLFDAGDKNELIKRLKHVQPEIFQTRPQRTAPTGRQIFSASKNPKLDKMLQQVKDVLPQIPLDTIRRDLTKTKSVDTTLTNFLEGRILYLPLTEEEIEAERKKLQEKDKKVSAMKKSSATHGLSLDTKGLSFQEKKRIMIEEAKRNYLEKHPEFCD